MYLSKKQNIFFLEKLIRNETFRYIYIHYCRCPTTDKWIKKLWYIYIIKYYLVRKKNEIMSFSRKWMELEIMAMEIRQT
jgi:hypothetical protein